MTTIVLMGDLGDPAGYHAGDEAMAEAAVHELSSRGPLSVIALTADPVDTSRRYGWTSIARFGFRHEDDDATRDARLGDIESAARGMNDTLAWDDPAWHVIHAVASSDAVLISGGGNLNSTWPVHVYERAALASVASIFHRPLIVSGQTLGPLITGRHGELMSATLTSARLVGVRESASALVAESLGVLPEKLGLTVDDASFAPGAERAAPAENYIAATFAAHTGLTTREDFVTSVARVLRHAIELTDADVVLIPHQGVGDADRADGDIAMHDEIRAALGDLAPRVHNLPVLDAAQIAHLTRGAELVLSSRYHPVVYALAAGVPALGLGVDAYTTMKIHGALANFGAGDFALSTASLVDGTLEHAVADTWAQRTEIAEALRLTADRRRSEARSWWDTVMAAIGDPTGDSVTAPRLSPADSLPAGAWSQHSVPLRDWLTSVSLRQSELQLSRDHVASSAARAGADVAALEIAVATLQTQLEEAAEEAEDLRASAHAAQELVAGPLDEILARVRALPDATALQSELEALRSTKMFRYLRGPRSVYARITRH